MYQNTIPDFSTNTCTCVHAQTHIYTRVHICVGHICADFTK